MNVAAVAMRPIPIFIPWFDEAVSDAAVELRATLSEALTPDHTSAAEHGDAFLEELIMSAADAAGRGVRVSPEALNRSLAFVSALPSDVPAPGVVIESDGEVGLDWDEGRRRVLTVSVGEGPTLTFASLIGPEPLHGRVPFAGAVPDTLAYLLRRLYSPA